MEAGDAVRMIPMMMCEHDMGGAHAGELEGFSRQPLRAGGLIEPFHREHRVFPRDQSAVGKRGAVAIERTGNHRPDPVCDFLEGAERFACDDLAEGFGVPEFARRDRHDGRGEREMAGAGRGFF